MPVASQTSWSQILRVFICLHGLMLKHFRVAQAPSNIWDHPHKVSVEDIARPLASHHRPARDEVVQKLFENPVNDAEAKIPTLSLTRSALTTLKLKLINQWMRLSLQALWVTLMLLPSQTLGLQYLLILVPCDSLLKDKRTHTHFFVTRHLLKETQPVTPVRYGDGYLSPSSPKD